MKFNCKIHDYAQLAKSIIGTIEFGLIKPTGKLFVLNFHGTPAKFLNNFEAIIELLQEHFEIISPSQFLNPIDSSAALKNNQVVLTFDDGLKNNKLALEILDRKKISAFLFIVPEFIDSPSPREYYLKNIRPQINPEIDALAEDFLPLTWEELKTISKTHTIGSHTFSHTVTKNDIDSEFLKQEIIQSKLIIENKLNITVHSFCSINNTLLSVNPISKKLIENNYNYHFTTIAGSNNPKDNNFIKRINVEAYWLIGAVKFSLGALNSKRFSKKISEYNSLK